MKNKTTKIIAILIIIVLAICAIAFRINKVNKDAHTTDRYKEVKLNEYFNLDDVDIKVNKVELENHVDNTIEVKFTMDVKKVKEIKDKYVKSYFAAAQSSTLGYIVDQNGNLINNIPSEEKIKRDSPKFVEVMQNKRKAGQTPEQLILRYKIDDDTLKNIKEGKSSFKLGFQLSSSSQSFRYINVESKELK